MSEIAGSTSDASRRAAPGGIAGAIGRPTSVPASSEGSLRLKHAHAGVAMAVATVATAASSGMQALLYLSSFGVDSATDAFYVAFALFAGFSVFSQSLRVSAVPLLVGQRPVATGAEFASTLGLLALPVLLATVPLAGPLAHVLTPGLAPGDRSITIDALPLLGGAMVLNLWTAGAATLLAVAGRFRQIATAYTVGALAGIPTYLAVADSTAELSLGWSTLTAAGVGFALMTLALRRAAPASDRRPLRLRRLLSLATIILGRTVVYLVLNALFPITLAFAVSYEPGDATMLTYAYVFTSYVVATTAFSLALSRIADMRWAALGSGHLSLVETVVQGFRYSMLLAAPALAGLVAAGAPLVGAVLPQSLSSEQVETLQVFAFLLGGWTLAALLVNLLLPFMFALGRARLVNVLALPLPVLHVAVTAAAGSLFGVEGVVAGAAIAPACLAAALALAGARRKSLSLALETGKDVFRFAVPAALSFGLAAWFATLLAAGAAEALIAAVLGLVLYAASLRLVAPRQAAVLAGGLRPLASE